MLAVWVRPRILARPHQRFDWKFLPGFFQLGQKQLLVCIFPIFPLEEQVADIRIEGKHYLLWFVRVHLGILPEEVVFLFGRAVGVVVWGECESGIV